MSFFTRTVVTLAVAVGVFSVFRKDVIRIASVLKKPAENFVKEVKKEIDAGAAGKALGDAANKAVGSEAGATASAAVQQAAAAAAEAVKAGTPPAAPEAPKAKDLQ